MAPAQAFRPRPAPARVRDGVWAIASPIPGGPPPYTLTYVLEGSDGIRIVDPGWSGEANLRALRSSLADIGFALHDVRAVVATHHHPDHLGIAPRLRELSGARIIMSADERTVLAHQVRPERRDPRLYRLQLEAWGVPDDRQGDMIRSFTDGPPLILDVEPDAVVGDGDELDWPGHSLRVVMTPGHTDGHLCLVDADRAVVYTGDHVLPGINSGIGLGTLGRSNPLADYLASLERLAPYDDWLILPGHEQPFEGLRARRAVLTAHHLRRTAEVMRLLPELGEATVWEYASRLPWTAGWSGLRGFGLHSALLQTERHLVLVREGHAEDLLGRVADAQG
ncbi:MBL fold metallo-hydrolase [Microbacterium sp. CFH 31415]|uniref:MBL fold metallo-hydrolase n=1 Tax=Microbacterium sp. CFH 31415 TaxID=2921732 RepID=UPI001F14073F|nr:MBL fold metallo-hydrolase [Microbacterium sp. CFH 31415]MCH6231647.1 MBL fold metallo-hydrolase [Microbacterium sp. CFH 31415]